MKKIFTLCLTFCFVLTLAGCGNLKKFLDAVSEAVASTESKIESKTGSSNESKTDIDDNIYYKSYPENPYAPHEIEDAEITTTDTEKTIKTVAFTISVPIDWECLEINGEDGSFYHFSHPTLGDNCKVMFHITGSVYKYDRTEEEYQEYLSDLGKGFKITSFTTGKIDSADCTKIVSTYSVDGTKLERIDLDNAVNGASLYDATTIRPAENEELESVLDNIVKSIKIPAKG